MTDHDHPLTSDQTADLAAHHWDNGMYCAESVLATLATRQGIDSELVPKIASVFCSGIAQTGGQCGALSGGLLALSMVLGRTAPEDSRDRLYQQAQQMVTAFEQQFGSLDCRDLLDLQLGTPEASEAYTARNLHAQCEGYIRAAARLAAELLDGSI
jgi:C_GCAxxG_C_C family probable redox protein